MKNFPNYLSFILSFIIFNHLTSGTPKTWTNIGGNSLWTTSSNWSGNSIPTSSDDVILDNTNLSGNYTVIIPVTGSAVCRTITIGYPGNANTITLLFESNSVLGGGGNPAGLAFGDGAAGDLDFSVDQGGVFINASTAVNGTNYIVSTSVDDSVRVKNGGKFIQVSALSFKNPFPALTTKFDPGSTFEENVRGTTSVAPDLNGYTYGNLILAADSAGGTRTYAAAGGGGGGTFNVVNTWTIKSGVTMSPSSLSGNVNEIIFNGSMGFTNNANSPLSILGNVVINAPFSTSATMTVNFTGNSTQTLVGSTPVTFSGNVNLNNPAGLILGNNTTVNGILTLTNGIITSSGTSLLTIGPNGSISGSKTSYINGPLQRTLASVLTKLLNFPIGKGNSFRPVSLAVTQNTATPTTYTAEMFNSLPSSRTLPSTLDRVSLVRYINIIKSSGANVSSAQVTINYDTSAIDDWVRDSPNLRIAKDDGAGHWLDIGGDLTATNFQGNITAANSFTTFGDFVLGNNSGGLNLLGFVPTAPLLITPINNGINLSITPTLVWKKSITATSYRLQLATDSLFTSIIFDDSTVTDSLRPVGPLQNNTKYYWRVSGKNLVGAGSYSTIFNFTTIIAAPGVPVLVSPANGSINQLFSLTLNWNSVTGAASYGVQFSTDSTFSSLIVNDTLVTDTSKQISSLSGFTKYYWRVKANNISGTGGYSAPFNFTTKLSAPQLLSPANGEPLGITSQVFTWSSVNGAQTYHFQLAKDSLFAVLVANDSLLTLTTTEVHPLTLTTKYYWRVLAKNQSSISAYSTIFNFIVAITGINDKAGTMPTVYNLYQNYPNPFNPSTIIRFDLPEAGFVTMKIYNILGKEVRTLVNEFRNAGKFNITFEGSNLPSGIYIYTIKANNFSSVRKMILLK